ncbi:hypothetical protein L4D06_11245 [Enterovibrio makurazakiensis]|uniref:DUF6891 domain-containing protein n=1 Tax=Enterovibrio makurazakiensis TaxID=2910232 RepID=UPI003D257A27
MKSILLGLLLITPCVVFSKEPQIYDVNRHILNAINVHVWSGFYSPREVQKTISYLLEDGADEAMLRGSVNGVFEQKLIAERAWPQITDNDRLNSVFAELKNKGILCLHNTGYTMSDGHEDSYDALSRFPKSQFYGYCFYHGQDLERAVFGGGLMIAYDHVNGDVPDKIKVGQEIKTELEKGGFTLNWNGTTNQRINIPNFDWKNRTSWYKYHDR